MTRFFGRTRATSGFLCGLLVACASLVAAEPEKEKEKERPSKAQAEAYRKQFEKVGRAGLPELAKDKDTSLALQASWELNKKVIARPKPLEDRTTETYDPDELKKFLAFFKERTKAPVPAWWSEQLLDLDVRKGQWHCTQGMLLERKETKLGGRTWDVREGVAMTLRDDTVSYTSGAVALTFPKALLNARFENTLADVSVEKITCLAGYNSSGAAPFKVAGFENKSGKCLWEAQVWAVDRRGLVGATAGHRAEIVIKGDTVFVFGSEFWGMYAEAFNLETGKGQFRFCTCYWHNYSEEWAVK